MEKQINQEPNQRVMRKLKLFDKIPDELMEEILLRIPSIDLAWCLIRYVCKKWFSIIMNSRFIYSKYKLDSPPFLLHSTSFTSPSLLTIVMQHDDTLTYMLYRPLQFPNETLQFEKTILFRWTKNSTGRLHVEDLFPHNEATCVNGLICFHIRCREVYICNPLTGEFVVVPPPLVSHSHLSLAATGFGFCSLKNKYKIVHWILDSLHNHVKVEILTLGDDNDTWRAINGASPKLPIGNVVVIDNVMYWKMASMFDDPAPMITLFYLNICTEEWGEIFMPKIGFRPPRSISLIGMEGKLCLLMKSVRKDYYCVETEISFWMLKDMTKLEEPWVIKYKFSYINGHYDDGDHRPMGIIANDIYVTKSQNDHMTYYDYKSGEKLGFDSWGCGLYIYPVPYVPSLIPIISR